MYINNPKPARYGLRNNPFPLALNCNAPQLFLSLRFLCASFTARTIPAKEPNAGKPANIGINGKNPPVLGIGIILGVRSFLLPPTAFNDLRAAAMAILDAFSRLLTIPHELVLL